MARKYENPFYQITVFNTGFDTGLKVEGKPLIFPPGKIGAITDMVDIIRAAQHSGALINHLGLLTVQQVKSLAKKGHLILTEKEGVMNPEAIDEEEED